MSSDSPSFSTSDCPLEVPIADAETKLALRWFVMRDLKRVNAVLPAYKLLSDLHFEVFTPMKWELKVEKGKRIHKEVPVIQDLLFVHAENNILDPVVKRNKTLQYRYVKGGAYCEPMTVREEDMRRFMKAVGSSDNPVYYRPEELTTAMCGRKIRIIGGPLDNFEGSLLTVRGSKVKRLLVELPDLLAVGVEVNPEYIQLI